MDFSLIAPTAPTGPKLGKGMGASVPSATQSGEFAVQAATAPSPQAQSGQDAKLTQLKAALTAIKGKLTAALRTAPQSSTATTQATPAPQAGLAEVVSALSELASDAEGADLAAIAASLGQKIMAAKPQLQDAEALTTPNDMTAEQLLAAIDLILVEVQPLQAASVPQTGEAAAQANQIAQLPAPALVAGQTQMIATPTRTKGTPLPAQPANKPQPAVGVASPETTQSLDAPTEPDALPALRLAHQIVTIAQQAPATAAPMQTLMSDMMAAPSPAANMTDLVAFDDLLPQIDPVKLAAEAADLQQSTKPAANQRFVTNLIGQIQASGLGEGQTRVELAPRGLGAVTIDISTAQDGEVSVVLRVENPMVLSSMRDARDTIAAAMGMDTGGSLDFEAFDMRDGQQDQYNAEKGGLGALTGLDEDPNTVETDTPRATHAGSGLLNMMT